MSVAESKKHGQYADDGAPYIPTEAEIVAKCQEIQATWTPVEEQGRRRYDAERSRVVLPETRDVRSAARTVPETKREW